MEAQAIQEIKSLVLAGEGRRTLETDRPALVLDGQIHDIEHLHPGRCRFRGKYTTNVLSEFVNYVKGHGSTDGSGVFIDADNMTATAFLNLGDVEDPGHADWRAALQLKPTAGYQAVRGVENQAQSQRELAEFCEDWYAFLSAEANGEQIPMNAAIHAIRELTIEQLKRSKHEDRDFGASRTALEDIEAKARGEMPTHLLFETQPYLGFEPRQIRMRISVLTSHDKPALSLRVVGREALVEDLAREFKTRLLEQVGESANVSIGTFSP
ncbi:DUF2303 family protein [Algiphilus aromaticivorans]|uniref:DUF2303 family protein n=1 Tax=Algiphilus aromaticivorans TaxID=382454 RepID=UPI0005C1F403|nr:DUF2303 family protein [Algiphilus aromaticivorans]